MEEKQAVTYTFRFPAALKDQLRAAADKNAQSVNQLVVNVLQDYLDGRLIDAERLLTDPAVRRLLRAAVELQDTPKKKR